MQRQPGHLWVALSIFRCASISWIGLCRYDLLWNASQNLKPSWLHQLHHHFFRPYCNWLFLTSLPFYFERKLSPAIIGFETVTHNIRGCSHIMSAKFGGFQTPPPPLVSNGQHLPDPPFPPRHQLSAFAWPPLPPRHPSSAFTQPPFPLGTFKFKQKHLLTWHFNGLRCVLDLCFVLALHSETKFT